MSYREPNNAQKQKIAIMRRQIFERDEDYRNWLESRYGERSCTDISYYEAIDCIDMLEHMQNGETLPPRRRKWPWCSHAQLDKINALLHMMRWDSERAQGFIERQTGRSKTPDMLTGKEATKVIVGLQKVYARGDSATYKILNESDADEIRVLLENDKLGRTQTA